MRHISPEDQLIADFLEIKIHSTWSSYLDSTYTTLYNEGILRKKRHSIELNKKEKDFVKNIEDKNIWNIEFATNWNWLHKILEKTNKVYSKGFCSDSLKQDIISSFIKSDKKRAYNRLLKYIEAYNKYKKI